MATPDHPNRQWIRSGTLCSSFLFIVLSTAMAQVGSREADEPGGRLRRPAAPQYDVIALRVEFQPDESRFSTGDGVFGGTMFDDVEPRVDPFPHDADYFDAHLSFLSNYVDHVSRGQTVVRTHLLPEIVRLSRHMGDYAPIGLDAETPAQQARLLALVREAWTLANEQSSFDNAGLDPSRTAFVLFHAGTGRDIELTGTVLDRTPEDLPSLFFGPEKLGNSDNPIIFRSLHVTNTVLIPETESKRGVDPISDEPFLLELSINGLLAASFFNFLGAPDLFDTSAGSSAVGPFGLMDPLGIFAFGGILPPEPSAWTRYYLGWTTPIELSGPEPLEVELRSHIDQALAPISSSEYFLAEVRHRDVQGDGLNLKVWKDGVVVDQRFDAHSDDFTAFSQAAFEGVLVDADDFDWVLPGGFDDTETLREGGILIWHVDERVISDGLASNAVNVDRGYRGVDLEEADSAQDIGHPSGNPFAPEFDRGTPFDFYFEGNPITTITATGEVTLYANRFGPETYPNSNSNGGGPSSIVLDNFGPVGTTMSLSYHRAPGEITPVDFETESLTASFGAGSSVSSMHFDIGPAPAENLLFHTGPESKILWFVSTTGSFASRTDGVLTKPVVHLATAGSDAVAFLLQDDTDEVFFTRLDLVLERPEVILPLPVEVRLAVPSTSLVGVARGTETEYYFGYDFGTTGYVVAVRDDESVDLLPFADGGVVSLAALPDGAVLVVGHTRAQLWRGDVPVEDWIYPNALGGAAGQVAVGQDVFGVVAAVSSPNENRLTILGAEGRVVDVVVDPGELSPWPILMDADGDHLLDIVISSGATLQSFSREGAGISGFPLALPAASSTQPLTATFDEEDQPSVLVGLMNGYLYAYQLGGRPHLREGFPLSVGEHVSVTPLITGNYIYTVSASGKLAGWQVSGMAGGGWDGLYGDALNRSFADGGTDGSPGGSDLDLIVDAETYNWPNPVRDGVTRLRVETTEPCALNVTIIDLAGNLVHSLETDVHVGGVPVEFEWRPEVESGVYFVRIGATTPAGRSDTKLYSIAVIR